MPYILSALWNGLPPLVDSCTSNDAEMKHLLYLIDRHQQNLFDSLPKEQQDIFKKYIDCSQEYLLYLSQKAFCRGFSFAIQLFGEAVFGEQ